MKQVTDFLHKKIGTSVTCSDVVSHRGYGALPFVSTAQSGARNSAGAPAPQTANVICGCYDELLAHGESSNP